MTSSSMDKLRQAISELIEAPVETLEIPEFPGLGGRKQGTPLVPEVEPTPLCERLSKNDMNRWEEQCGKASKEFEILQTMMKTLNKHFKLKSPSDYGPLYESEIRKIEELNYDIRLDQSHYMVNLFYDHTNSLLSRLNLIRPEYRKVQEELYEAQEQNAKLEWEREETMNLCVRYINEAKEECDEKNEKRGQECLSHLRYVEIAMTHQEKTHKETVSKLNDEIAKLILEKDNMRKEMDKMKAAEKESQNKIAEMRQKLKEEVARTNRMDQKIKELKVENRDLNIQLEKQQEEMQSVHMETDRLRTTENVSQTAMVKVNQILAEDEGKTNKIDEQIKGLTKENNKLNIRMEKREETRRADPDVVEHLHPAARIQSPQPIARILSPGQFKNTPRPAPHFQHAGHIQPAANFDHTPNYDRDFNQSAQMRQAAKFKKGRKINEGGKFNRADKFKPAPRFEPISEIEPEHSRLFEASKMANGFMHGPIFRTYKFKEFPQLARCFYNPEHQSMPQVVKRIPKNFVQLHADKNLSSSFQSVLERKQKEQEEHGMVMIENTDRRV